MPKNKKRNPARTNFDPVVHTWPKTKFKKWFERLFDGNWEEYYKGKADA